MGRNRGKSTIKENILFQESQAAEEKVNKTDKWPPPSPPTFIRTIIKDHCQEDSDGVSSQELASLL